MNTPPLMFNPVALFDRVKLIITKPRECWDTIALENSNPRYTTGSLLLPLLALGAIFAFVGMQVFGLHYEHLGSWHRPWFDDLRYQLIAIILFIVRIFAQSYTVKSIAKEFGGQEDFDRAFALLAHVAIPEMASHLLSIFPSLVSSQAFISLLWLLLVAYTSILVYHGAYKMMGVPKGQQGIFAAASLALMLLVYVGINIVGATLSPTTTPWSLAIDS